jgi:hypothetical protein
MAEMVELFAVPLRLVGQKPAMAAVTGGLAAFIIFFLAARAAAALVGIQIPGGLVAIILVAVTVMELLALEVEVEVVVQRL